MGGGNSGMHGARKGRSMLETLKEKDPFTTREEVPNNIAACLPPPALSSG